MTISGNKIAISFQDQTIEFIINIVFFTIRAALVIFGSASHDFDYLWIRKQYKTQTKNTVLAQF